MTSPAEARGFTLLEMVVVLVILGLAMGLLMAHGPLHSRTLETRAVAAEVARLLRGARGEAIARDRPEQVVLDLRRHGLIVDGRLHHLPSGVALSAVATAGEIAGTALAGFRFDPDGGATGGRIELRDRGGLAIQVGVDWLTGRVSVVDAPHA